MLGILRKTCPFPTIDEEGTLFDGLSIAQPLKCRKCVKKSCRQQLAKSSDRAVLHDACEYGYSVVSIPTTYGSMWVNGVFVPFQNTAMDAKMRKANKSQKTPWEQVIRYAAALQGATAAIQAELREHTADAVAGLHDIKTAVGIVLRNAEAIVSKLPGYDDYERIENADSSLKSLLKSVNLLDSRLKLGALVANPDSASYGQKRQTPVYKLFHRMVRLFEEIASRRRLRLRMDGISHNRLLLYDSIETLPLVLIDNAIKYAEESTEIIVKVDDVFSRSDACIAQVESFGPIVPEADRAEIFKRGFRSVTAMTMASSGSGLGLFIARIVADANRCQISYSAQPVSANVSVGRNVFTVHLGMWK